MEGDWQWGNFYYNMSYPLEDITGCHLDENLAILGMGNEVPVIMMVDPKDGGVISYTSIEKSESGGTKPNY